MQTNSLRQIIATLQRLRDDHHSQLNARDLAELDNVLEQLRSQAHADEQPVSIGELAMRALHIMDVSLRLATNLADLMK